MYLSMLLRRPSMLIQPLPPMSPPLQKSRPIKSMISSSRSLFSQNLHHLLMLARLLYNNPIKAMKLPRASHSTPHLNHQVTCLLRITPFIRGMLTYPRLMDFLPSLMRLSVLLSLHAALKPVFLMNNIMSPNRRATAMIHPVLS